MFDFHAFISKPLGIGYFSPLTQLPKLHVILMEFGQRFMIVLAGYSDCRDFVSLVVRQLNAYHFNRNC